MKSWLPWFLVLAVNVEFFGSLASFSVFLAIFGNPLIALGLSVAGLAALHAFLVYGARRFVSD